MNSFVKAATLSLVFLFCVRGSSAFAAPAQPVNLVAETISDIAFDDSACKIVRSREPRAVLTYKVARQNTVVSVSRPIYSDLCETVLITQQGVTRVYSYLSQDPDKTPIVGVLTGPEDTLSFPVFSGHVLRSN